MCNVYVYIVISFPEAIVDDRAQQLVVRHITTYTIPNVPWHNVVYYRQAMYMYIS